MRIVKKVGLPQDSNNNKKKQNHNYLTVGNLAEKVGVSARTIKHWEDKGIIEPDMRSDGGFRLYPEVYIYLCQLIKDLQLFGYSLEEIKKISDFFRDFLTLQQTIDHLPAEKVETKLQDMLNEVETLYKKMDSFKEGIQRWEELMKKKRKEINTLRSANKKRLQEVSK